MTQYSAENLREILQDRARFQEVAEFFIRNTLEEEGRSHPDKAYLQYLQAGLKILLSQATEAVFTTCESPIEKVFVNTLFLVMWI